MYKILIICLLISQITNAQKSLTGKITDSATGETIAGATIYIPELKTGTVSGEKGIYRIDNLPAANVIIQVGFLGYRSKIQQIDLSLTATLDFSLVQAITEMNEVVVTGASRTTEIVRSPVPVAIVTGRDLQQTLNTNIIDAVAKIPGISAVTTGPNVSKPFIHGLGFNRVLTLFDGVRQEGQQWGAEHGIEVDENAVDHIEVIKGPASLTYGSDALSGVVNLIPFPPVPDGTIQGHTELTYHTNNNLIGAHMTLGGNRNGFIWGGEVSHKQAKNYRNKYDGRVYGTAFNETDLSGFIGLNRKWGYSHLNLSMYDDLQEIPDGSRDSLTRKFTKQITEADTYRPIVPESELNSYKISAMHQLIRHFRIYSTNNFITGKTKLKVILAYQENIRSEFSHPQFPGVPGLDLLLRTFTYDIKYTLPLKSGWETIAGINGMYQVNTNKGTEFIIPDYHLFDFGPFIMTTRTFDRIEFSGGIRFDIRNFRNHSLYTVIDPLTGFDIKADQGDTGTISLVFKPYQHIFNGLSASLGLTYNITEKLLLKANIARGFRAPNIAELSANGIHPGTLIYQFGNTGFRPEFSLQEDLGISFRSDHISGSIDVFNNNVSNYIFNQKLLNHLGRDSVIIKGNQTFEFRQTRAQIYGGEATLDIHPYDWLHFENSVSLTCAYNRGGPGIHVTDSSRYLPFIPPFHTNTELRANLKTGRLSSYYLKIGIEYFARQDRIYSENTTETPTTGYLLVNAGIGGEITNRKGKTLASINILGNNITDRAYQSHMSRLKYFEQYPGNPSGRSGIYDMGRNISFRITFPLILK